MTYPETIFYSVLTICSVIVFIFLWERLWKFDSYFMNWFKENDDNHESILRLAKRVEFLERK